MNPEREIGISSPATYFPDGEAGGEGLFNRVLQVTFFSDFGGRTKREETLTLHTLAARIRTTTAAKKSELPWLKLARFGEHRTDKRSLRHDANILTLTGIEADYDSESLSLEDAAELLLKAGVLALLYTSPSHTPTAPRWRILCPLSEEALPSQRDRFMGRLNGLFRGVFASESWTLSQSYYYGSTNGNPAHQVELIEGTPIDRLDELDEGWMGKPNTMPSTNGNNGHQHGAADEGSLLREIACGNSYHEASIRLLGLWARQGVPYMDSRQRLINAFEQIPAPERDARWHKRRGDLDRCLDDIYSKAARQKDAEAAEADEEWPEPVHFLADGEITGTPELTSEHLPNAISAFVFDTAQRMGADPAAVALAALVSCSSVASDNWQLQPKRFDPTWLEAPRIWGAILGPPSVLKTPIIQACTRPIDKLEIETRRQHGAQMLRYKAELAKWKKSKQAGDEPRHPVLDRYLVENLTVEALTEVLRDDFAAIQRAPAGKVLIRSDELAELLSNLDRYHAGGRGGGDRGAFLRLYNGGRHTVDRVNRGAFACPNWSACLLGSIQPGPIQRIAREAADDGMLQRFLFCVPESQGRGQDRRPDHSAIARYEALFPALAVLRPPRCAHNKSELQTVALHANAHSHRDALVDLIGAMQVMPDTSPRLQSALGKFPGLSARLTLLFHLIDIADARAQGLEPPYLLVVPEATARRAIRYLREIALPHLMRADATMFATVQMGHARWIAGFILARGCIRVTRRAVTQAYSALRAPEAERELTSVMTGLVSMGWLREEESSNPVRPPAAWAVNPRVHTIFAVRGEHERLARKRAQENLATIIRERQHG